MSSGFGSRPWLIVPFVAAVHGTLAVMLLINPGVSGITVLHFVCQYFGSWSWQVLMLASVLAITPMVIRSSSKTIHLLLWPQQGVLLLMAMAALQASVLGAYPDGVIRPSSFIFADQCYAVYAMVAHLAVVIRNSGLR